MITDDEWLKMLDYDFKLVQKAQRQYCLYSTKYNHKDIGCSEEDLQNFLKYCKEFEIIISHYNSGALALEIEGFKKEFNFFKKLIKVGGK